MCCILFSSAPVEKDPRFAHNNAFQTPLSKASCASTSAFWWCLCQCIPLTAPCTQIALRRKVLGGHMSEYVCCQEYFGLRRGQMPLERRCPSFCLCLEAHCCLPCAVSASRMVVMDKVRYFIYSQVPDSCLTLA